MVLSIEIDLSTKRENTEGRSGDICQAAARNVTSAYRKSSTAGSSSALPPRSDVVSKSSARTFIEVLLKRDRTLSTTSGHSLATLYPSVRNGRLTHCGLGITSRAY